MRIREAHQHLKDQHIVSKPVYRPRRATQRAFRDLGVLRDGIPQDADHRRQGAPHELSGPGHLKGKLMEHERRVAFLAVHDSESRADRKRALYTLGDQRDPIPCRSWKLHEAPVFAPSTKLVRGDSMETIQLVKGVLVTFRSDDKGRYWVPKREIADLLPWTAHGRTPTGKRAFSRILARGALECSLDNKWHLNAHCLVSLIDQAVDQGLIKADVEGKELLLVEIISEIQARADSLHAAAHSRKRTRTRLLIDSESKDESDSTDGDARELDAAQVEQNEQNAAQFRAFARKRHRLDHEEQERLRLQAKGTILTFLPMMQQVADADPQLAARARALVHNATTVYEATTAWTPVPEGVLFRPPFTTQVPKMPGLRIRERIRAMGYDSTRVSPRQIEEIGRLCATMHVHRYGCQPFKVVDTAHGGTSLRDYYGHAALDFVDHSIVRVLGAAKQAAGDI